MVEAYPLQWPTGWNRTEIREHSNFRTGQGYNSRPTTHYEASNLLSNELNRLGAKNIVLSSNLRLKQDGLPYSKQIQPEDVGIAVYFEYQGNQQCIPCDKWKRAEDNIKAIAKTIEAIRGIDRWGAKDMVTAAFKGFQALPDYTSDDGRVMTQMYQDYFSDCEDRYDVHDKYKRLRRELHPDQGGDAEAFKIMMGQYKKRMENKK